MLQEVSKLDLADCHGNFYEFSSNSCLEVTHHPYYDYTEVHFPFLVEQNKVSYIWINLVLTCCKH